MKKLSIEEEKGLIQYIHNFTHPLFKLIILWAISIIWGKLFLKEGKEFIWLIGSAVFFYKGLDYTVETIKGLISLVKIKKQIKNEEH